MSYIKTLPKTTFKLPNGELIESVNLLKSFIISDSIKNSNSVIKKKYYDQVKRPEYISWKQYGQNLSLYWLVLMLNDIDSFRYLPKAQTNFETKFKENNPGKVYYIKNAVNATNVLPGDLIVMVDNTNTWKYGGIVKEYDSLLRRIILVREIENTESTNPAFDTLLVYRKNGDSWIAQTTETLLRGRVENEYEKTIKFYETANGSYELSPFVILDGSGNPTEEYDFTATDSNTLIYRFCNNETLSFKLYDYLEDELVKLSSNKDMKFTSTGLAFKLNSFITTLSSQNFERGQRIELNI